MLRRPKTVQLFFITIRFLDFLCHTLTQELLIELHLTELKVVEVEVVTLETELLQSLFSVLLS